MKSYLRILLIFILFFGFSVKSNSAEKIEYLKTDWVLKDFWKV